MAECVAATTCFTRTLFTDFTASEGALRFCRRRRRHSSSSPSFIVVAVMLMCYLSSFVFVGDRLSRGCGAEGGNPVPGPHVGHQKPLPSSSLPTLSPMGSSSDGSGGGSMMVAQAGGDGSGSASAMKGGGAKEESPAKTSGVIHTEVFFDGISRSSRAPLPFHIAQHARLFVFDPADVPKYLTSWLTGMPRQAKVTANNDIGFAPSSAPLVKDYLGIQTVLLHDPGAGTGRGHSGGGVGRTTSSSVESLVDRLQIHCCQADVCGGIGVVVPGYLNPTLKRIGIEGNQQVSSLNTSGQHEFLVSNCGSNKGAMLYGSLRLRQVYGYLPGVLFGSMVLNAYVSILWFILLLGYLYLLYKYASNVSPLHYVLVCIYLLAFLQCLGLYTYYFHYNVTGVPSRPFLVLTCLVSVSTNTMAVWFVLAASQGWGVVLQAFDKRQALQTQALVSLYAVVDLIRQATDQLAARPASSVHGVLLTLPRIAVAAAVFFSAFASLSSLMQTLEEERQHEKTQLFSRLWAVLVAILVAAACMAFAKLHVLAQPIGNRWKSLWWYTDGLPQLLFIAALIAVSAVLSPSIDFKHYATRQEVPTHDVRDFDGGQSGVEMSRQQNMVIGLSGVSNGGGSSGLKRDPLQLPREIIPTSPS
eukprot:GHVU01158405.1.p1 GENE.GHVU01158405.1~~GHVU01158405.1.p1  ORF type:complete len:664 (+),score=62.98 GHVU01158405.1:69-1994(+)